MKLSWPEVVTGKCKRTTRQPLDQWGLCRQRGFTLIEVMASLVILAFLSIMTARTVREALSSRQKYQYEIGRDASIRDSIRIVQTDVTSAFNFRDSSIEMYNQIVTATPPPTPAPAQGNRPTPTPVTANPPPGQTPTKPKATPKPTPVALTHFVGNDASMFFTVSNHVRSSYDARESDLARVGYYINTCKSRDAKTLKASTRCLFRSYSPYLLEDVTKVSKETRLVENVSEFKLRYVPAKAEIGENLDDVLVDSWRSDDKGPEDQRGHFPLAVEISLTIHNAADPRSKPTSMIALAPLRFPNNPTQTPAPVSTPGSSR